MILDHSLVMSDAQALTAEARSTNVIDTTKSVPTSGVGAGAPVKVVIRIDEAFTGPATVRFRIQTDAAVGFGTAETLFDTSTVAIASLPAGKTFEYILPATGVKRYLSALYTPNTTASAGKISAYVVLTTDAVNLPPLA
jgi:hypothetical protein